MARPALFVDRDGTLIADAHYPSLAEQVVLLVGAAEAVKRANDAGVPVVVVTNQSGIGRGLISELQYEQVRARLDALLAEYGAHIDATFHCPHWPERDGACRCRKPNIGMHQDAASALKLSLTASAYIGDRWRDIQPAITTGGLGILVVGEETPMEDVQRLKDNTRPSVRSAETIGEAIDVGLAWITKAHR